MGTCAADPSSVRCSAAPTIRPPRVVHFQPLGEGEAKNGRKAINRRRMADSISSENHRRLLFGPNGPGPVCTTSGSASAPRFTTDDRRGTFMSYEFDH